ncbi:MAG: hypothetical protein MK212_02865 [Saprospiraceae bacterium]|nr:hypothetical protein [Saprospiraceae bacterium]
MISKEDRNNIQQLLTNESLVNNLLALELLQGNASVEDWKSFPVIQDKVLPEFLNQYTVKYHEVALDWILQLGLENQKDFFTSFMFQRVVNHPHLLPKITAHGWAKHVTAFHWGYKNIGQQIHTLSKEIAQCTQITYIDISMNQIDRLPKGFQHLHQLERIWGAVNNLQVLPEWLPQLKSLKVLLLPNNQLSTIVDHAFEGLEQLNNLSLRNNNLEKLPTTIQQLQNLEQLDLAGNTMLDFNPTLLEHLAKLEKIHLPKHLQRHQQYLNNILPQNCELIFED